MYTLSTDSSEWLPQWIIDSPAGSARESHFGRSVSVTGTTIVVGAPGQMADPYFAAPSSKLIVVTYSFIPDNSVPR